MILNDTWTDFRIPQRRYCGVALRNVGISRLVLARTLSRAVMTMIQRAEEGLEAVVITFILGAGIVLGLGMTTWQRLAIGALCAGILLNVFLLVRGAIVTGNRDRVFAAALGGVPAGVYDALKIFLVGLIAQWIARAVS